MATEILRYAFQNEELLWEALQAYGSGVYFVNQHLLRQGNRSLSTIGGAVIELAVTHRCYREQKTPGWCQLAFGYM